MSKYRHKLKLITSVPSESQDTMIVRYEDTLDNDDSAILKDFDDKEPPLYKWGTKVKLNESLKRTSLKHSIAHTP